MQSNYIKILVMTSNPESNNDGKPGQERNKLKIDMGNFLFDDDEDDEFQE